jgi:dTDP-4-dehydrorhamnose 3,5-epimerase
MANYQPAKNNQIADRIHQTAIPGLYYINHAISPDTRGYFAELAIISDLGKVLEQPFRIKQINLAHSNPQVIRGFHAEGWNKLITLVRGTAFSALVDIRPESPTFGQFETFLLGDREDALHGCLYITKNIANSVCVVAGPVDYLYCVDELYRERETIGDQAISLFDPDIKITWPIPRAEMIVSERDQQAITLRQKFPEKFVNR